MRRKGRDNHWASSQWEFGMPTGFSELSIKPCQNDLSSVSSSTLTRKSAFSLRTLSEFKGMNEMRLFSRLATGKTEAGIFPSDLDPFCLLEGKGDSTWP